MSPRLALTVVCAAAGWALTPPAPAATDQRISATTSEAQVRETMLRFNRALGVECTHCHVQDRWQDESKPQLATARNMIRMVGELNGRLLLDVGDVACWTCHRGQVKPSRLPRAALDAQLARWPALLGDAHPRKLAMAVYSVTLGVECEHCHVRGDWKSEAKRPLRLVSRMTAMFDEFPKFMPETARTQCWMCHKGSTKPEASPSS